MNSAKALSVIFFISLVSFHVCRIEKTFPEFSITLQNDIARPLIAYVNWAMNLKKLALKVVQKFEMVAHIALWC